MGLGDHIICNGLVRHLISSEQAYYMFVKPHNLKSVQFMYKDINNLNYITANDDLSVINFIKLNNVKKDDLILAGFTQHPLAKDFDDNFYLQNDVPFEYRWTKFKCDRDLNKEKDLFNKFNIKENEYVFVHDDIYRNYEIDTSHIINKHLPVIKPIKGDTENIFDYCYLMEKSLESHFIDSSFRLAFDSLLLRNSNIFFHVNLKNNIDRGSRPRSRLDFIIL